MRLTTLQTVLSLWISKRAQMSFNVSRLNFLVRYMAVFRASFVLPLWLLKVSESETSKKLQTISIIKVTQGDPNVPHFGSFLQQLRKLLIIFLVRKNGFRTPSTVHHMIPCILIFDSKRSWHNTSSISKVEKVKSRFDPFSDPFSVESAQGIEDIRQGENAVVIGYRK